MKKIILAAAAVLALVPASISAFAATEVHIPKEQWGFSGVFGGEEPIRFFYRGIGFNEQRLSS